MKKNIHISASFDQPELLENMVEKLAHRRAEAGYGMEKVMGDWQLVDNSSIEKYVSGTVDFTVGREESIRMPFITCFVFSCTKEKNDPYKLHWSMSLS